MSEFDLKDLLEAVGPTASLIFAAWIFLTFLQARYTAAYERFRALIAELRSHRGQDQRRTSLRQQILLYKRRCEQMRLATNIGDPAHHGPDLGRSAGAHRELHRAASPRAISQTFPSWPTLSAVGAPAAVSLPIWLQKFERGVNE
jgi:hypothetical protein